MEGKLMYILEQGNGPTLYGMVYTVYCLDKMSVTIINYMILIYYLSISNHSNIILI